MTLQQLKYVVEVADKGSMSEAAKKLFISQPSLSSSVKELEKELNINIFLRSNKGIVVTSEGTEFLGYARQVIENANLIKERYEYETNKKKSFSVSTQHYSFAVEAFVEIIKKYGKAEFDFTLRETKTSEIIEDVKDLKSEIGILYINKFNKEVFKNMFKENDLEFIKLFRAEPHIFVSSKNPLSKKKKVKLKELEDYVYLSFEQGKKNSFYYSEEILSTIKRKKNIKVSDRATLFNFLIGLNGYTISSGIIDEELNGKDIVSVPLESEEYMDIGYIKRKNIIMSEIGKNYINSLEQKISSEVSF